MIKSMTKMQKTIAYSSLAFILFWVVFLLFTIWLLLGDKH